jgi:hypothetical protein
MLKRFAVSAPTVYPSQMSYGSVVLKHVAHQFGAERYDIFVNGSKVGDLDLMKYEDCIVLTDMILEEAHQEDGSFKDVAKAIEASLKLPFTKFKVDEFDEGDAYEYFKSRKQLNNPPNGWENQP